MKEWDAIVIGSGAGGGVAAQTLVEHGLSVLVLERGNWLSYADEPRDHLRNHRLAQYGHNTGPELEGNDRVAMDPEGNERIVQPHQGGYQNIASCVGSGTLVYGGQAWRFHPIDFKMASTYGVPEGSSLADWPITHDDLAPYYEQVEHLMGVSGGPPSPEMPARREYPMPPVTSTKKSKLLKAGADRLGWSTQVVPLLISSTEWDGRPGCCHCQHCVGFMCPVDAKNGTQNVVFSKWAGRTDRVIKTGCVVTGLELSGGRCSAVRYIEAGTEQVAHGKLVFVAASAIESARLLMLSGIDSWALGRNLQGHYYAGNSATFEDPIWDGVGPGAGIATLKFNHGNDGVIGGGMLADDFIMMPIVMAKWNRPSDVPAWGKAHKDWMRYAYPRYMNVTGPVQDIPSPHSRVQLDPTVKDRYGLPVARLSGATHPETVRTAIFMQARSREWLLASGANKVWGGTPELGLSAGQHQAGTCRMGDDPSVSVVDRNGRLHGFKNLFVADGSVHVTNGGFNPVLTIMALARRTAALSVA